MYLPINGRIAIIDNEIKEAYPLFKIFSKNRIPYLYIDASDSEWLPQEDDEINDIRLIFLDLNLTGDRTPNGKEVKSILYSILKRVISPNNFPYSIILWSKQEYEYANVVKELFLKELKDRQPILIKNFVKSDYFELDGEVKVEPEKNLLEEIKNLFQGNQAYSSLVYWENKVHKSADNVLQNIFTNYEDDSWTDKSNFIIDKLGQGYLGFKKHKISSYSNKIKGALQAFNTIFSDTLEYQIHSCQKLEDQPILDFDLSKFDKDKLLDSINEGLLISKTNIGIDAMDFTGTVSEDKNPRSDTAFQSLFNDSFDRFSVESEIAKLDELSVKEKSKKVDKAASDKRKLIRENWQKIYVVLTPLCDKVQDKQRNIRVVKGFIMNKEFKKYLDDKTEAIFISPPFYDSNIDASRVIVLNFRYFFTFNGDITKLKDIKPIFRIRQTLVSEIQSKLARHISRQGILYIE